MFKAVIFDFGGIVVKMNCGPRLRPWLKRLSIPESDIHRCIWEHPAAPAAMRGEMSAWDFWKRVGQRFGLDGVETLAFKKDYISGHTLDEQVLKLIQTLASQGVMVGLLSNSMDDAEQILEHFGFKHALKAFDTVVLSYREGMVKPDPEIYRIACRRLGVHPSDAVHIDDLFRNIEGAQKAKLTGWHYRRDEFDKLVEFLFNHP